MWKQRHVKEVFSLQEQEKKNGLGGNAISLLLIDLDTTEVYLCKLLSFASSHVIGELSGHREILHI